MTKNKSNKGMIGVVLVLAVLVGGGIWFFNADEQSGFGLSGGGNVQLSCPDDGDSSVTFNLLNGLNDTASETFDATAYLEGSSGHKLTVTDTTAGTATLNCGETYTMRFVATDADGGDASQIMAIESGANAQVSDGNVVFTPNSGNYALDLVGKRHGVLEFRMWDTKQAGWMCNSDDTCTDYETDGVAFESTTNGTAMTIGAGGEVHVKLNARATTDAKDFSDFGVYILVDADSTKWDKPTVKFDGQVLGEATLTSDESIAWSGYEYVYYIDKPITRNGEVEVDFQQFALSGINPGASDDIQIDFGARGQYLSVNGATNVNRAGVKDDSSRTVVYSVQDVTIDIA